MGWMTINHIPCFFYLAHVAICMYIYTYTQNLESVQTYSSFRIMFYFVKRHFFWLRALLKMVEPIFQKLTLYMGLIAPTDLLSYRGCYLILFAPFCVAWYCQYLVFNLLGAQNFCARNVPALLMNHMSHECNIEKYEKSLLPGIARRKSAFSQRKRAM